MDDKRKDRRSSDETTPRKRYERPELKLLGDVRELTQGGSGSVADALGFAQHSSLRFKRDVSYLDDGARASLMRSVLSMRLAQWEYKEDPARERRLGIIIEDDPNVAAINAAKDSVDLYAYTSMAIAAIQVQADEIASLRDELKALREELRHAKTDRH
jgi:hypothetical protein